LNIKKIEKFYKKGKTYMSLTERICTDVRAPFRKLEVEEVAVDSDLLELVKNLEPEAVICLPQFPNLVYLRMQPLVITGYGISVNVKQRELGLFYDRDSKSLVDIENREDGLIQPTGFDIGKRTLLARRHGIGKEGIKREAGDAA
jgi:hypothetical protein